MNLKDSIYWQIFGDVWTFFKKYADVQADDEYWQTVVDEADKLHEKYKGKPEEGFAKCLILDVISELESVFKRRKEVADE